MRINKPGWTDLLRREGPGFLSWLASNEILEKRFDELAVALASYLESSISSRTEADAVWAAAPAVLNRCNEQDTYALPSAPVAYAWLHLLDRYARTWCALELLVESGHLPLAKEGIRALDIGSGPGPAAFAVHDFYSALTTFATERNLACLNQPLIVTCVEFDSGTNLFRHHLAETLYSQASHPSNGILSLCSAINDFAELIPPTERAQLRARLRWEEDEYFDEARQEWIGDLRYTAEEANQIAQSLHRYRLVVISNFLTTLGVAHRFEANLASVLQDSRPGSVVLLLGGKKGPYPEIYSYVNQLAAKAGFQLVISRKEVSATDTKVADRIVIERQKIYKHIQTLAPNQAVETAGLRKQLESVSGHAATSEVWAYRKYGGIVT